MCCAWAWVMPASATRMCLITRPSASLQGCEGSPKGKTRCNGWRRLGTGCLLVMAMWLAQMSIPGRDCPVTEGSGDTAEERGQQLCCCGCTFQMMACWVYRAICTSPEHFPCGPAVESTASCTATRRGTCRRAHLCRQRRLQMHCKARAVPSAHTGGQEAPGLGPGHDAVQHPLGSHAHRRVVHLRKGDSDLHAHAWHKLRV